MEKINEKLKSTELLECIEDTRRTRSVMYLLTEVLFIMLGAILSGTTSYVNLKCSESRGKNGFKNI
jgi:hypothetical protein